MSFNFLAKQRKIRFDTEEEEEEKDTRVKYKPAVSPLQVMMLKMAGQVIPMVPVDVSHSAFIRYIVRVRCLIGLLS